MKSTSSKNVIFLRGRRKRKAIAVEKFADHQKSVPRPKIIILKMSRGSSKRINLGLKSHLDFGKGRPLAKKP